ncbi:hypothetical protein VW29_15790 [Devosia limi DSM 17137]|uniref:DUF2059 domain-containing protein n=2 Tax=Devosia TaxID=46913 RepID=A0A0F5LK08_9HYPH|nr:hypothetical protein VW29_15790 [Devosia limi DSM 17137]SHE37736.1 hypothetical protein SAMN02745223_00213 [Devosia limi DSM 17137]
MGVSMKMGFAVRAKALVAVVLSAGMIALAMPAVAQEVAPEHLALARKYVDLTDRSAIYEVTIVETGIETMRQIVQQNPEIIDQTDAVITKTIEEYKGRKGELLDQFARIYAVRFSMDELQQIVNFYESPVGLKLAQANAEVNVDLQRVMEVFTGNLKREFFAKVRADLRAQGIEI